MLTNLLSDVVSQQDLLDLGGDGGGVELVGECGHLVERVAGGVREAGRADVEHLPVGGEGVEEGRRLGEVRVGAEPGWGSA